MNSVSEPSVRIDDAGDYLFMWLDLGGVDISVKNLYSTNGGTIIGEISIDTAEKRYLVQDSRINFSYQAERERLWRSLLGRTETFIPWDEIIEYVSSTVISGYRTDHQEQAPAVLKKLSDIEIETVSWLWYPYIPLGKLTLIEGDPGIGKSWATLALATAVSLGAPLPKQPEPKSAPVLLVSAEDGYSDTVKPRLKQMGANMTEIFVVDGLFTLDETGFESLDDWIFDCVPGLIIIDPLVAYLSREMDTGKANQVRWATARLAQMAAKWGTAVLAVRHLTKGNSSKAIYRGIGSIDFTAAARSVLLAGADPDDEKIKGIVHLKSNLAPLGDPIGYELRQDGFFWTEKCELTANKILTSSDGGAALKEAMNFLLELLCDGEVAAVDGKAQAETSNISIATLNRAKAALNIQTFRKGEQGQKGGGKWYWKLPENGD